MLKEILSFLEIIPLYISFVYPVLYLFTFRKNPRAYGYFTAYIVLMALVQLIMKVYIAMDMGESNLFMFIYFMMFQFITLSLFFYDLLRYRFILFLLAIVLAFVGIQYALEPSLYFKYNPIGIIVTQVILVGYSLVYFYRSLSKKQPFAIVNYGMFIYLVSSVLIFASGNLIFNKYIPASLPRRLRELNLVLYFVFQIFIVVEWVKNYSGFIKKTHIK